MKHVSNRKAYTNITKVFIAAIICITAFLARADYPIMSQHYAADPTAVEWNGRLYVYCSNDEENNDTDYLMDSIVCFSTDDLKNWTDHGVVFDADELSSWYSGTAWAPCIVLKDNQFYLYYGDAYWGISVVTSSSPTGPFTAPENALVVKRASLSGGTPGADSEWLFDPGVFVDDDGSVHLFFGGGGADQARYIELETNMHDAIGSAVTISFPDFFEASHMHKYNGVYYYSYADNYDSDYTDPPPTPGSQIGYMTSSSPSGPFTYRGVVLGTPPTNFGNNNHHTLFTYQGDWYCVYHNRYQANLDGVAVGTHRNICLDRLYYNPDGTMQQVVCTQDGLTQLKYFDPYVEVEAETLAAQSGVRTQSCSEGGMNVTSISNGDWIRVRGVNFQGGADLFLARVAATNSNSSIELRLDSLAGTLIGTCNVPNTGGVQTWTTASCTVSNASGVRDLYFSFDGPADINLFNFNNWRFVSDSNDITPPEPNVMTWASLPGAVGSTSITMTAATATDVSSPVQYYFECTTDGDANSTWQTNATYLAQGLNPSTEYSFRVKARDSSSNLNETGWSTTESATTEPPSTDVEILGSWATGTSHNKESGTNRALIFIAHGEMDGTMNLASVTYGGQSMTKVVEMDYRATINAHVVAYILDEAGVTAATNNTFIPTWDTDPAEIKYASVFLGNVNQTDLTGDSDTAGGTSATISTSSLTTNDGDMVIDAATCGNLGTYTLNSGFTQGTQESEISSTGVTGYKSATGSNETPSVTHSSVNRQVLIGFVIQAAPTGDYQNCAQVQLAGYGLASDLTDDCYVNLEDMEIITGYWLNTNCGTSSNCDGADFAPVDGDVDLEDFSDFAVDWLLCNNPGDSGCIANW